MGEDGMVKTGDTERTILLLIAPRLAVTQVIYCTTPEGAIWPRLQCEQLPVEYANKEVLPLMLLSFLSRRMILKVEHNYKVELKF